MPLDGNHVYNQKEASDKISSKLHSVLEIKLHWRTPALPIGSRGVFEARKSHPDLRCGERVALHQHS